VTDALPPATPRGHDRNPGFTNAGSRIDGLAYAALVMGVVSLVFNLFVFGPPALLLGPGAAIMGFISRRRVANSGGTLRGGTIALAGLILGIIGFAVNVAWLFLIVVVFGPGIRERSSG
jgi:Domain of unknown function (DUF4190)